MDQFNVEKEGKTIKQKQDGRKIEGEKENTQFVGDIFGFYNKCTRVN